METKGKNLAMEKTLQEAIEEFFGPLCILSETYT